MHGRARVQNFRCEKGADRRVSALDWSPFSQRSFRRKFITRAIELAVDVKVIAGRAARRRQTDLGHILARRSRPLAPADIRSATGDYLHRCIEEMFRCLRPFKSQKSSAHRSTRQNLNSDDHFDRPFLFMPMKGKIQNQIQNQKYENN
jgi:hypothetical protein